MKKICNMKKTAFAMLLVVGILLTQASCSNKTEDPSGNETTSPTEWNSQQQTDDVAPSTAPVPAETEIATSYGTIPYPSTASGNMTAEIERNETGEQVTFYGTVNLKKLCLYTISFGIPMGDQLGEIQTDHGSVGIYVSVPEFSKAAGLTEAEQQSAYVLKESVNDVTQTIQKFDGYVPISAIAPVDPQTGVVGEVSVSTPYGELSFTSSWSEQWVTEAKEEADGYTLLFSTEAADRNHTLFTVCFGAEDGYFVGWIEQEGKKIPVSFTVPELEAENAWSEDDKARIQAMMENLNDLLNAVRALPGYSED